LSLLQSSEYASTQSIVKQLFLSLVLHLLQFSQVCLFHQLLQSFQIVSCNFWCWSSDRHGLSFYSYDAICSLLELTLDQYMEARDGLIEGDLIAFDGTIFQVLELPGAPAQSQAPEMRADITQLIRQSLKEAEGGR
jgi:hypothetical protein